MNRFEFGMKLYNTDWFLKYGLSYKDAARTLRDWGVTLVLARSRPVYDDRKLRDALAAEGIEYWITARTFYEPEALFVDPPLRPIGADGQEMERIDWYVGINPAMERFVVDQTARIEQAVRELEPDGVFLSFTRWPGFWELWMPHHTRQDFPEYSYDRHTLDRFMRESGVEIPTRQPAKAAAWIEENARQPWTEWKCRVIVDVVRQVKDACQKIKPDIEIMLNTLPFGAGGFDGAQEKVFGQHIETLADIVDVFEVMTYHQILNRPANWVSQAGEEVKRRSGRKTVCTIQVKPIYLDGIYAKDNRSPAIPVIDTAETVEGITASNLDGIIVFTWADLLVEVYLQRNTRRLDILRAAARGA